jgi:gas vesicle protein
MGLFSKKSTFLIGSLVGSVVGLLFARESGKSLRQKLVSAGSPQKKFEALFEEYLKVGKSAIEEAKKSEALQDLMDGGKEILAGLKEKAKTESGTAIKFAQKKATEILKEVEKQAGSLEQKAKKKAVATGKKVLVKANAAGKKVARKVGAKAKKVARRKARKTKK